MALTSGFNPTQVTASINAVKTSYNSLMNALINDVQIKFINGMQNEWACKEAQQFYQGFKTVMDSSYEREVNSRFSAIVNNLNVGAQRWAARTGNSSTYTKVPFTVNSTKLDVSCIHDNIGGSIGINETNALNVSNTLDTIMISVDNALTSARNGVNNCGFLNTQEVTTIQTELNTIKKLISDLFKQAKDETKKQIKATVQAYSAQATSNANRSN